MVQLARTGRSALVLGGVGVAYFALALAAILFTRLSDNVALLWVANAMLLAALCTRPAREHRQLLLAAAFASYTATMVISPFSALAPVFVAANIGEALLGWKVLAYLGQARGVFLRLRSIPAFVLAAGLIAPAASGLVASIALWLARDAEPAFTWANWMIGHGLGALIGTPVALLALGGRNYWEGLTRRFDVPSFVLVMAGVVAVVVVTFSQSKLPLLFLPILPAIIATAMFRFAGAALSVFAIAVIGAVYTMAGHGPVELLAGSLAQHLQFFQFYIGIVFLIALPFATLMAENRRLSEAVAASEARYRMIADNASDAMLTLDPWGTIRFASPAVRELTGFEPLALIGRNALSLIVEEDREHVRTAHLAALAAPDSTHRVEYRGFVSGGATRWFETTARAVAKENGRIASIVSIVRDLSLQKAREADLERQARTDPMTGVLNRRAFLQRLDEIPPRDFGHVGTLAMLDLDHFKRVNDRLGHAAGDAALLSFADVMRANLRGEDVIARMGGEEFAILFPTLSASAALAACERLRHALEITDVATAAGSFRVTVSIGLAPMHADVPADELMRRADAALYRAKAAGRNRTVLSD
ncbi:diguanylate cyclase [Sphingomonas sp. MS122]|uniref:sensor domain-containing diguanylate cyclase n=1 Tax=Sphingomonas sp. MS122 TaxID=3412683 RepID=UPI003C2CBD72